MPPFNVIIVGAGEINFGSPEGPWNHSIRLEALLGADLCVLCIIDPDTSKAQERVLEKRTTSSLVEAWSQTRCFATVAEAAQALHGVDTHLILNGCPPHFRGTEIPGKDMDLQLLAAFPSARGIFVEKPAAAADPISVDCDAVAKAYAQGNAVVGVGYMFRYLAIVDKVKALLEEHNLVPMCINARYIMAYEYARKQAWWNKDQSCGPVVEQATHFVDLIRYLAGSEVRKDTVHALTVEHNDVAGELSKLGIDEDALIPPAQRVPRTTTTSWSHAKGTVSSLSHCIALHGTTYSTEIDIVADGWLFRLSGFYTKAPTLSIIRNGTPTAEVFTHEDDPFLSELAAVVRAVRDRHEGKDTHDSHIKSSYSDALETYKLTWAIRRAGEKSRAMQSACNG